MPLSLFRGIFPISSSSFSLYTRSLIYRRILVGLTGVLAGLERRKKVHVNKIDPKPARSIITLVDAGHILRTHATNQGRKLTRISQRDRLGVNIPKEPADRRQDRKQDRTGSTHDQRVEDGGLLMRGPAQVADGGRPEVRLGHGDGGDREVVIGGGSRKRRIGPGFCHQDNSASIYQGP